MDYILAINTTSTIVIFLIGCHIYYSGENSLPNRVFSLICLFTSMWCLSVSIDVVPVKLSYFIGTIIVNLFYIFSNIYSVKNLPSKHMLTYFFICEFVFFYLLFFTNLLIVEDSFYRLDLTKWEYGVLNPVTNIFFISVLIISFINLFRVDGSNIKKIKSAVFLKIAFIIGFAPPLILSILLPSADIFKYQQITPALNLFWLIVIGYAIFKHQLFNIKTIAVEIATFALWVFLFLRLFIVNDTHEMIVEIHLLIVTVAIGIMLIRSLKNEMKQQKKIDALTQSLAKAYENMEKK